MSSSAEQPDGQAVTLSWSTEDWLTCHLKHGLQPYQVCVSRCTGPTSVEGVFVTDAPEWLCEVRCRQNTSCNRKWLACNLCGVKFPGRGNLSGKKRSREYKMWTETAEAIQHHQSEASHVARVSAALSSDQSMTCPPTSQHQSRPDEDATTTLMQTEESQSLDLMSSNLEEGSVGTHHPSPPLIVSSTNQSPAFTSALMRSTIDCNSNLGNFIQKEDSELMSAPRHIVSVACEESRRHGDAWKVAFANPAPLFGSKFMFKYTRIFNELSVKSRRMLVDLVDVALETPPAERLGPNFGRAKVPSTFNDANRVCIRGTHSIMNSLPLPRMVLVGAKNQQHVCAHPLDVIRYTFTILPADVLSSIPVVSADQPLLDTPPTVSSYFESKDYYDEVADTMKSLRTHRLAATIQIMVRWFSDAWDPDSTKDNRNGVWSMLMTVMLGPEAGDIEVVYPLAIGPKSGNHSHAVDWVLERVRELGDYVIIRDVPNNRNVRIRVRTSLIQVDRLERGELWGGLNHASNRGKCHGVVAGYSSLRHERFAPCTKCGRFLVCTLVAEHKGVVPQPTCDICACYDPTSFLLTGKVPSDIRKVVITVPMNDYAPSNLPDPDPFIVQAPWQPLPSRPVACRDAGLPAANQVDVPVSYGPVVADQHFMVAACRFLSYHAWKGNVKTKDYTKAWAEACGIAYSSVLLPIFEESRRHHKLGTTDFCDVFTKELLPPTWLDPSWRMEKFLHAPMHLLFLGLTQKIMEMLDKWMAHHTIKSSFNSAASNACNSVGKLRLDWLKLLKYGVSTLSRGSWVSEQYVALSKFMLIPVCGLVLAKGIAVDELKVVLRVFDSCFCMLSFLMRRSVDDASISRSETAIKVYLMAIDEFGRLLHCRKSRENAKASEGYAEEASGSASTAGKNGYLPISLNNPNHCSALRMVLGMSSHGPPCDQWDGKLGNEASIGDIKESFHGVCMVDGGCVEAAMKRYYRQRYLQEIGDYMERNEESSCSNKSVDDSSFRGVVRYKNHDEVGAIIEGSDVTNGGISALLYENEKGRQVIAVAVGRGNRVSSLYRVKVKRVKSLHQLLHTPTQEKYAFVSDFVHFGLLSLSDDRFQPSDKGFVVVSKVCLVSARHVWSDTKHCRIIQDQEGFHSMFTVVSDDYRKLRSDGRVSENMQLSESLWSEFLVAEARDPIDWESLLGDEQSDVYSLTVAELKCHLRRHGKPLGGRKDVLLERVLELLETIPELLSETDENEATTGGADTAVPANVSA